MCHQIHSSIVSIIPKELGEDGFEIKTRCDIFLNRGKHLLNF
jgi:hypothetical protein